MSRLVLDKKKNKKLPNSKVNLQKPVKQVITLRDAEIQPGPTNFMNEQQNVSNFSSPNVSSIPIPITTSNQDAQLLDIAKKYKVRLAAAEEQIKKLMEENANLHSRIKLSPENSILTNQIIELEAKLRDTTWRLQQVQTQYDHLSSKNAGQINGFKDYEAKLEDYSIKVRDLRRALEDLRYEKEISDAKADKVTILQDQLSELKKENRNLEDKISKLCETPFINDSFKQREIQLRYEELLAEKEALIGKVEHLQEAVRTNYSALTTLKHELVKLRDENDELNKKNEELKLKYSELEVNSNVLESKLKLYSGDDGIDLESLEKALTLVKRKSDGVSRLSFLETLNDPNSEFSDLTLPIYKRKLEQVQIMNMTLSNEIEKFENMLKLQTNINRDLHTELELGYKKHEIDVSGLRLRVSDLESLNTQRLNKIQALEAQLRQLIYNSSKYKGKRFNQGKNLQIIDELASTDGTDNLLLSEFLDEGHGDLKSDENLLEIWCKDAVYVDNIIRPGSSSFIIIDFFDYESQTTSLQTGNKPKWDFAATFKVNVDDFLLRYLATDVAVLEFNMATGGDFTLLSRTAISLAGLLRSKPVIRLINHPILSVDSGELIGHVNIDIRLALPVSELYRLYLTRYPLEKHIIEDISTRRYLQSASALENAYVVNEYKMKTKIGLDPNEESRLYNEIEVCIVKATGLPKGEHGELPTPYVFFQMLSFPDKFTNPVPLSTEPEFNERFVFPLFTNDQSLRLLQTSRLMLCVVDMTSEDNSNDKENGLIGEVAISLTDLAGGNGISSIYSIKSKDNHKVGEIEVSINWKYDFKQQRDLGPRALSNIEVEILLSAFSASNFTISDGIVDYHAFCRFINPPRHVWKVIERLRAYVDVVYDQKKHGDVYHGSARDIFRVLFSRGGNDLRKEKSHDGDQNKITSSNEDTNYSEEHFVQKLISLNLKDIQPSDFIDLFQHIDTNHHAVISLDQFISMLNLDEEINIPKSLLVKLQTRVSELLSRSINLLRVFDDTVNESFATNGVSHQSMKGLISRLQFKKVLQQLGFLLVDEPDHSLVTIPLIHDKQYEKKSVLGEKLDDNAELLDNELLDDSFDSTEQLLMPLNDNKIPLTNEVLKLKREEFEQQRIDLINKFKDNKQKDLGLRDDAEGPQERLRQVDQYHVGNKGSALHEHYSIVNKKEILNDSNFKSPSENETKPAKITVDDPVKTSLLSESSHTSLTNNRGANFPTLLEVENQIRSCLDSLHGVQSPPNLLAGYLAADTRRTGLMSRQQFAVVLQQFPILKLHSINLGVCMNYFNIKKDEKKMSYSTISSTNNSKEDLIDYQAFCSFISFKFPELLPANKFLSHQIALTPRRIQFLYSKDKSGIGYLSRKELQKYFHDIGYGHLTSSIITNACELFEIKEVGSVNYLNLIEYISENALSQAFAVLQVQFYNLVAKYCNFHDNDTDMDNDSLRSVYNEIKSQKYKDERATGFSSAELIEYLQSHEINAPVDAIVLLFTDIDSDNNNQVFYADFIRWLRLYRTEYSRSKYLDVVTANVSVTEIQQKLCKYILVINNINESEANSSSRSRIVSVNDIYQAFEVYDVKKSGVLFIEIFIDVTRRLGFLLTKSELTTIVNQFLWHENSEFVNYLEFISWCMPSENRSHKSQKDFERSITHGPSFSQTSELNAFSSSIVSSNKNYRSSQESENDTLNKTVRKNKIVPSLIRLLEKKIQHGIDLLQVFGRYDKSGKGRLHWNDFCAGLGDLGISSTTHSDVIDLADRFKATVGDYILYRRIISELLRYADDANKSDELDIVDIIKAEVINKKVSLDNLKVIFSNHDRYNNGKVYEEDINKVFAEANISLKSREVNIFCDKYSMIGNGKNSVISYEAFLMDLEKRLKGHSSIVYKSLSDDLVSKLSKLIDGLILNGHDYRNEFDYYDENFNGTISKSNFHDLLQDKYHGKLTYIELTSIDNVYEDKSKDSRNISYLKFFYDVHPRFSHQLQFVSGRLISALTNASGRLAADELKYINEILDSLRLKIRRRCNEFRNVNELKKPFKHFARRKSNPNRVTLKDFEVAVKELGMKVTSEHTEVMFLAISSYSNVNDDIQNHIGNRAETNIVDHSWEYSFHFVDFILFVCDPYFHDVIWKFRRLLSRSYISNQEVMDGLLSFDKSNSGIITFRQFSKLMKSLNIDLSESDLNRLALCFHSVDQGLDVISVSAFANFITGRSDSKETDNKVAKLQSTSSIAGAKSDENKNWNQLKQRIEEKLDDGMTSHEVFSIFDVDNKGVLDLAALQLGARELGLTFSRSDTRAILQRMTVLSNSAIDKKAFYQVLEIDVSTDKLSKRAKQFKHGTEDLDADYYLNITSQFNSKHLPKQSEEMISLLLAEFDGIIGKLRIQCDRLVDTMKEFESGEQLLLAAFNSQQEYRVNELKPQLLVTQKEFYNKLKEANIHLTRSDVKIIFDVLDSELVGNISVYSFVGKIYPSLRTHLSKSLDFSPSLRDSDSSRYFPKNRDGINVVPESYNEMNIILTRKRFDLLELLLHYYKQMQLSYGIRYWDKEFKYICEVHDKYSSGRLERGLFGECLKEFGLTLKVHEVRDLVDSIAEDSGRGGVDYNAFIHVLSSLSNTAHVSGKEFKEDNLRKK